MKTNLAASIIVGFTIAFAILFGGCATTPNQRDNFATILLVGTASVGETMTAIERAEAAATLRLCAKTIRAAIAPGDATVIEIASALLKLDGPDFSASSRRRIVLGAALIRQRYAGVIFTATSGEWLAGEFEAASKLL